MPELELVEERLISGVGVLRVPETVQDGRYYQLCIDVIREVSQPFESFKYTPTRSRYCTLSFMRSGYVIEERVSDYKRRAFDFVSDIAGQVLIAVKCVNKNLILAAFELSAANAPERVVLEDKIADYQHLDLFWDEVVITCESTTAIQVRLFVLEHADDCESSDPFKPPPPPPPLPEVPPATSIGSISRPYNLDPFTNPDPLDEFEEDPPLGEECAIYRVDFRVTRSLGSTEDGAFRISGEYREDIAVVPGSGDQRFVGITARGTAPLFGNPPGCGDLEFRIGGAPSTSTSDPVVSVILLGIIPL